MFCMLTKGKIVRDWRDRLGLSRAEVARRIGTSRQNIDNLESDQVDNPHYLAALAKLMGYRRVDDLLELKLPPGAAAPPESATGPAREQAPATVAATIARLGELLAKADPKTRDAAAQILMRYAQDPDQGKLAKALEMLLAEEPGVQR